MKTLIIKIGIVVCLISTIEVKAQNPVNIIEFKVEGSSELPQLVWSNKREVNTSYYIIEYSLDNINFKTLNTRKALGQSNFPVFYNFVDIRDKKEKINQICYYRVVLVLMGGNRLISESKAYIPIDTTLDQNVIANLDK